MMPKLVETPELTCIYKDVNGDTVTTSYKNSNLIYTEDMIRSFLQFMVSCGFTPDSINDLVLEIAHEIEAEDNEKQKSKGD